MSSITTPPDFGPVPVCTFCSTPLINYGARHDPSGACCCRRCALEVLPVLVADAIGANETGVKAEVLWQLVEGRFWKQISARNRPPASLQQGDKS